jgi:hypothetical protein
VLDQDVPEMVRVYDANPSPMLTRPSVPKRVTTGRQISIRAPPVRAPSSPVSVQRIVAPPVGEPLLTSARAFRLAARVLQSTGV